MSCLFGGAMRNLTIIVILIISSLGLSFFVGVGAAARGSLAGNPHVIFEDLEKELAVERKTESAYKLIAQLRTSLNTVIEATTAIPQSLDLERIHASIREISALVKQVSSENGVNLDAVYESIDETTTDVSELKDKVERLKVLLNLNREIVEKLPERAPHKKPLIKTWFESGSVILKILVVNPSETESQTIPLRIYLPKEVSPKDIIDLGDLELEYDPDTGVYSVHNEVTLGPGQSMTKMVEMEDVWVFPEEQLSSFVTQAREMASRLEETPYAEEAAIVTLGIEQKVQEIVKRQEETAANPSEHIRAYRQGITMIATIEQDLSELERLEQDLSELERLEQEASAGEGGEEGLPVKGAVLDSGDSDSRIALVAGSGGPPEGGAPLGQSISMTTAWRLIFAILTFLAVLSFIFFMTWHRVVRVTMEREQQGVPLSTELQEVKEAENNLAGPQPE